MSRQFGLRTGGSSLGGNKHSIRPPIVVRGLTHDNSDPFEPLLNSEREIGASVFVAACFSAPFIITALCVGIIKLFS